MKRSLFNCAHPFRQRWSIGCLAVALSCASLADEAPAPGGGGGAPPGGGGAPGGGGGG
ncbi:hypothetical protein I5K76_22255, partial [Pseudomonas aeruginosa]|nr:hypothetical protein [Pseudomonas aeruginosa]